ncbi:hypothetical protein SCUP234_07688 [Seiridium cupressi]
MSSRSDRLLIYRSTSSSFSSVRRRNSARVSHSSAAPTKFEFSAIIALYILTLIDDFTVVGEMASVKSGSSRQGGRHGDQTSTVANHTSLHRYLTTHETVPDRLLQRSQGRWGDGVDKSRADKIKEQTDAYNYGYKADTGHNKP